MEIETETFQLILLTVGIVSTVIIAGIFKSLLKPKIEKIFNTQWLYVHQNILGKMNRFDTYFEVYYEVFEKKFGNIKDLPIEKWAHNNPEIGGTMKNNQIPLALKLLHTGNMKQLEEWIIKDRKEILDFLKINQIYFDPVLSRHIEVYLHGTVSYICELKYGFNLISKLYVRRNKAKSIIWESKKTKEFYTLANVSDFTDKWEAYLKSENID